MTTPEDDAIPDLEVPDTPGDGNSDGGLNGWAAAVSGIAVPIIVPPVVIFTSDT